MKSQNTMILDYLLTGKVLTPLEALHMFGCFRLAARIAELRKQGYTIFTDIVKKEDKTFAGYKLVK